MLRDDNQHEREGFLERYRAMGDTELLSLAKESWALSDAAWDALEDELERRNLEVPEAEPGPQFSAVESRNLVLLRRFRDVPEALLAKGKLESMGIECVLGDENMVRMDWFLSNLLGGVKLLVEPEDFTQASQLLNEPVPEQLHVEGVGDYVQPRCPKCGSLDIAYGELDKKLSYTTAWLGVPIPISSDGWRCHECGNQWDDVPEDGN